MSALRDAILSAAPGERHRLKAVAFGKLASLSGQSWTRGAITATIVEGPWVDLPARLIGLSVRVERRLANGTLRDVTPPNLNPLLYVNLPILVPDPAGDVTLTGIGPDGSTVTQTYREDPRAALLLCVRDTLRGVLTP